MSETTWDSLGFDGLDQMTKDAKISKYNDKQICFEELRAILYVHIQSLLEMQLRNSKKKSKLYFEKRPFQDVVSAVCGSPVRTKLALSVQYVAEKILMYILRRANTIAKKHNRKHPIVTVRDINLAHNDIRDKMIEQKDRLEKKVEVR